MQRYRDVVLNSRGEPVPSVSVLVLTYPAGALANLFADDVGTVLANPVTSDPNGAFSFKAANGHYSLVISGTGVTAQTVNDVVLNDAADTLAQLAAGSGSNLVTFLPAGAGAVARTLQQRGNEQSTLADFTTAAQAATARAGLRLYVGAGEAVTLNVPAQFATIQAALDAIAGWVIASSGTVTIQVADGTYSLASSINLNHPYGDRLRLLGNLTTPDNCVLQGVNPPTFDALVCSDGHQFGQLDGFKVDLSAKATAANNYTAVLANNGATLICGAHMKTNNWYYGIAARNKGGVYARFAAVDNAGDVGIWAETGGFVDCRNATSNNASDATNGLGFGFQAEHGSTMDCSNASATGCQVAGIASLSGSSVRAWSATTSSNTGSGFYAFGGSVIEAHNAAANNNTRYGIEELDNSRVFGNAMTLTGNTLASSKAKAYLDNTTLGPRIVGDSDFRIDLSGAYNWFFNSAGGLQMSISNTASAVNRWNLTGSATGQALTIAAVGTDANIQAVLAAKGAESALLFSNGVAAFRANNVSSSAVNYGQVDGAVAGSSVDYKARGTDTNIDLGLSPKGTGVVKFGAFTTNADAPVTGYITIKDASGVLRKLAVIA